MNHSFRILLAGFFAALSIVVAGCGSNSGGGSVTNNIPAPRESVAIRPGDTLLIDLYSIPKPTNLNAQVDNEGRISLAYLGSIQASGKSESELAREIKNTYIDRQIYAMVDVNVAVSQRYIYVGGEVRAPGRVTWTPDLTLTKAIQSAGGYGLYADKNSVILSRDQRTYTVNAKAAETNPSADPKLYPGDSVNIKRSIFN